MESGAAALAFNACLLHLNILYRLISPSNDGFATKQDSDLEAFKGVKTQKVTLLLFLSLYNFAF